MLCIMYMPIYLAKYILITVTVCLLLLIVICIAYIRMYRSTAGPLMIVWYGILDQ